MKLQITATLDYDIPQPADLLLQVEAAIIPEQFIVEAHIALPPTEHFARLAGHDTIGDRLWLRMQGELKVRYTATVEVNRLTADIAQLHAVPPHLLPTETVDYMLPSRFCPSDKFQEIVGGLFGNTEGGARVTAIRDWIQQNLTYESGVSDASTDAMGTYEARKGVCRDFAHLMVSMTRASAIPARFVAVYGLGVEPQDFHAVAEVFLDNTWYMVDATGMSTPDAMAKIGVGRDAADVSFLTSYGKAFMKSQSVEVTQLQD
jgi:transglutaminase-like putative cysteine protease